MEHWWNDTEREIFSAQRQKLVPVRMRYQKSPLEEPGFEPWSKP